MTFLYGLFSTSLMFLLLFYNQKLSIFLQDDVIEQLVLSDNILEEKKRKNKHLLFLEKGQNVSKHFTNIFLMKLI